MGLNSIRDRLAPAAWWLLLVAVSGKSVWGMQGYDNWTSHTTSSTGQTQNLGELLRRSRIFEASGKPLRLEESVYAAARSLWSERSELF